MVEKAPEWNIGVVAGVPTWCIFLIEKIIERYQLKSIHEIWPNFHVYMHGGVFMKPYLPRINKVLGDKVHCLDTYLASEGYFAYQAATDREGMELLLNNGIFFEFIPFNSDYFTDDGSLRNPHQAFTLNEVEEGVDYAIVISTNAGLWRYMIGDLVRFVDKDNYEIIITGRIRQFVSLVGEHLSLDNINNAIQYVGERYSSDLSEFCLYADGDELRHYWFLGSSGDLNEEEVMKSIDKEICNLNDDYASSRKYNLKDPVLKIMPNETFYEFMSSIGKSGAQNKFPRVLNGNQTKLWMDFLSSKNLL